MSAQLKQMSRRPISDDEAGESFRGDTSLEPRRVVQQLQVGNKSDYIRASLYNNYYFSLSSTLCRACSAYFLRPIGLEIFMQHGKERGRGRDEGRTGDNRRGELLAGGVSDWRVKMILRWAWEQTAPSDEIVSSTTKDEDESESEIESERESEKERQG